MSQRAADLLKQSIARQTDWRKQMQAEAEKVRQETGATPPAGSAQSSRRSRERQSETPASE